MNEWRGEKKQPELEIHLSFKGRVKGMMLLVLLFLGVSQSLVVVPPGVHARVGPMIANAYNHPNSTNSTASSNKQGLYAVFGNQLYIVNTTTGARIAVGVPFNTQDLLAQEESVVDEKLGVLWLLVENATSAEVSVLGLNIRNGDVVKQFAVPVAGQTLVGVGSYIDIMADDSLLLVGGPSQKVATNHDLFQCVVATGTCKLFASVPATTPVLGAAHWYHPLARVWMLQVAINKGTQIVWVGISVDSGKTVVLNLVDPTFIEGGFFYGGSYFGIGFTNSSFQMRALSRWTIDPRTLKSTFEVIAPIPGYFIIEAGMVTFDKSKGTLYALLQPATQNPQGTPLQLVQIDLAGNLLNPKPPQLCGISNCPWALEYFGSC